MIFKSFFATSRWCISYQIDGFILIPYEIHREAVFCLVYGRLFGERLCLLDVECTLLGCVFFVLGEELFRCIRIHLGE